MNAHGVNTEKASIARVYDAVIGGKDNFEVDREVAEATLQIHPAMPELTTSGRKWLIRTVGHLADRRGMDQFLDLGAGLPTVQNTHEIAQRERPEARVVYVDNDPAVNAYGRALLTQNRLTSFATADLTSPDAVFAAPEVAGLDWMRPMVLMQCLTLHHVPDAIDPWKLMRRYIDALPSGSYVALSHLSNPHDGGQGQQIAEAMERAMRDSSMESGWFRSPEQVKAMLDELVLLEPGLVPLEQWWPSGPREPSPADPVAIGAVAYKP